jgi:hypothetical protein
MGKYQFEGTFRDASWTELPSPEEVKESVARAIGEAHSQVFGIQITKVDVSDVISRFPERLAGGYPEADVVVRWETEEAANG